MQRYYKAEVNILIYILLHDSYVYIKFRQKVKIINRSVSDVSFQ